MLFIGLDRSIYKGVLIGFYIWLIGTLMMRWGATSYTFFDTYEQLGELIGNLIFGLSLGFLVPRMAMQNVSESNSIFTGLLAGKLAQPAYKPNMIKNEQILTHATFTSQPVMKPLDKESDNQNK